MKNKKYFYVVNGNIRVMGTDILTKTTGVPYYTTEKDANNKLLNDLKIESKTYKILLFHTHERINELESKLK